MNAHTIKHVRESRPRKSEAGGLKEVRERESESERAREREREIDREKDRERDTQRERVERDVRCSAVGLQS